MCNGHFDVALRSCCFAFGYFNPEVVRNTWNTGREKLSPREAARTYFECCGDHGRAKLAGIARLEAFCEAPGAVNDDADLAGLTLYAAARSEPMATVPRHGRCSSSRCCASCGAAPTSSRSSPAGSLRSGPTTSMTVFGRPKGDVPEVAETDRRRIEDSEALTDRAVMPAYGVLDAL
ncbi:MAG: helix-turn-helix domain-containing protein [Acidimicrobiales bacterium]